MANDWLGLGGTSRADLNLVLQIVMGVCLLVGMVLARRRRFRAHQICQTTVVVLNLVLIVSIMAPSFSAQVQPHVTKAFGSPDVFVPLIHAALGTVAEVLAIYVVLVAGTSLLPCSWRFRNYRPWMRTTLVLWWIVIALGIGIYGAWYRGAATPTAGPPPTPAHVTVTLGNFAFDPQIITVPVGTTVDWTDTLGRHTVEFDDGTSTSPELTAGHGTSRQFDSPGTYTYHCSFHGGRGGSGMSGTVIVTPRAGMPH